MKIVIHSSVVFTTVGTVLQIGWGYLSWRRWNFRFLICWNFLHFKCTSPCGVGLCVQTPCSYGLDISISSIHVNISFYLMQLGLHLIFIVIYIYIFTGQLFVVLLTVFVYELQQLYVYLLIRPSTPLWLKWPRLSKFGTVCLLDPRIICLSINCHKLYV